MINLSVVIITLNEEKNINRCLQSVKKVADEIVIIDSFSTDKTKEISINNGAKFFSHVFEGHIEQKNYSLTQCTYNHVLSLDADEALSNELVDAIIEIKKNWQYDGYYINRLSNYCGKWIKHCGWYPDKKLRLFDKRRGKWGGTNPHDKFILESTATSARLTGNLLHYTINSIEEHIKQTNYFSGIAARMAYERGRKGSLFHVFFYPLFKFIRDYFFKLGFLDGIYGFVICVNSAHAKFLKYLKLRELHTSKKA